MRNFGLNICNARKDYIIDKIESLEKKYDMILPKRFKQFCDIYEIGNELFRYERYYIEELNEYRKFTYLELETEADFNIDTFLTIEEIYSDWKTGIGYGREDYAHNYVRIATISRGGALFVGTKEPQKDKIIVNIWDEDPGYYEVAGDIYAFLQRVKLVHTPEKYLLSNVKYEQLYKRWSEDYWRIADE